MHWRNAGVTVSEIPLDLVMLVVTCLGFAVNSAQLGVALRSKKKKKKRKGGRKPKD